MTNEVLGPDMIQAEYERLGYNRGWSFMATPELTMRKAEVAFVGLNPGGGGEQDTFEYQAIWDFPGGNAYFNERWGPNNTETAIQRQIWKWHKLLGISPAESFCAHFIPFRSPTWDALKRKDEAVAFGRRLWVQVLDVSPASLFVTMGKEPARQLASVMDAKRVAPFATGWGNQMIDIWDSPDGRRVMGMPHPSRYTLFGRNGSASDMAEENFLLGAGRHA